MWAIGITAWDTAKALSTTQTVVSTRATGSRTSNKDMVFSLLRMAQSTTAPSRKIEWLTEWFKFVLQAPHPKKDKRNHTRQRRKPVSQQGRRLSRILTKSSLIYPIWLSLKRIQVKSRRKCKILCWDITASLKAGTRLMQERLKQQRVRSHSVWHLDRYGDSWETAKFLVSMLQLLSSTECTTKERKIILHC